MFKMNLFMATVILLSLAAPAAAQNWGPVDAHVIIIEPSNMGTSAPYGTVYWTVDQQVGDCAPGTFLVWVPRAFGQSGADEAAREAVNSRSIHSTLQISLVTGYKVKMWGNNKVSGTCQVTTIYSLNQ